MKTAVWPGDSVKLRGWGDEWFLVKALRESGAELRIDVTSADGTGALVNLDAHEDVWDVRKGIVSAMPSAADPVHSPAHYDLPGGIQVIDLIRDESFLRGNLIKYIFRAPHKGNELEDLKKAVEYLKWEIERVENANK